MIEERDDEDETNENRTDERNRIKKQQSGFDSYNKICSRSSKASRKKSAIKGRNGTPVKTFGYFETTQEIEELRVNSGDHKSPLKSLINFTISPS